MVVSRVSYVGLHQIPVIAKLLEKSCAVFVLLVDIRVTPYVQYGIRIFLCQVVNAVIKLGKFFKELSVLACCWQVDGDVDGGHQTWGSKYQWEKT